MSLGDFLRKVGDVLSDEDEQKRRNRNPQEGLLEQVIDAVTGQERDPRTHPNIRPASEDPLGDPADQGTAQQGYGRDILPASQDPRGDPADLERARQAYGRDVLPASQDPLGDPADQQVYGRPVLPASQDPLGDPADQLAGRDIRPASEDPLGDPADGPPRRRRRRGLFG